MSLLTISFGKWWKEILISIVFKNFCLIKYKNLNNINYSIIKLIYFFNI